MQSYVESDFYLSFEADVSEVNKTFSVVGFAYNEILH